MILQVRFSTANPARGAVSGADFRGSSAPAPRLCRGGSPGGFGGEESAYIYVKQKKHRKTGVLILCVNLKNI